MEKDGLVIMPCVEQHQRPLGGSLVDWVCDSMGLDMVLCSIRILFPKED